MTEEWRPVVGFEGIYEVSSCGRVRSVDRFDRRGHRQAGRLRVPQVAKRGGYHVLNLRKDGRVFGKKVHHLVALAFLGPPPGPLGIGPGRYEVNHKDGDKLNCAVANLEYCTRSENMRHAHRLGLAADRKGTNNGRARLMDDDVREIRRLHAGGVASIPTLAREFGVAQSTVGYIVQGVTWSHLALAE